jgi:hypothetical protein
MAIAPIPTGDKPSNKPLLSGRHSSMLIQVAMAIRAGMAASPTPPTSYKDAADTACSAAEAMVADFKARGWIDDDDAI